MRWCVLMVLCVGWWAVGAAILPQTHVSQMPIDINEPQRLVTLAPNLTEIAYALGLGDQVVAVTQFSDYPQDAQTKPKVGSFWRLNLEAIVGKRPDLVLTLAFEQQQELAARMKRMSVPVQSVNIQDFNDLIEAIEVIGEMTDRSVEALELTESLQQDLEAVRTQVKSLSCPKVLWVIQREPLRAAGTETFINWMIEQAGGVNAMGPTLHQYPPVGAEQVIACQPDVIIEQTMGSFESPEQTLTQALAYWQRYTNVPAVLQGRIYVLDGDLVTRMGPRIVTGIEHAAHAIHADALGGIQ